MDGAEDGVPARVLVDRRAVAKHHDLGPIAPRHGLRRVAPHVVTRQPAGG